MIREKCYDWKTPHGEAVKQSSVYTKQHLCLRADGAHVVINDAEMPVSHLGWGEPSPSLGVGVGDSSLKRNKHERQVWKDAEKFVTTWLGKSAFYFQSNIFKKNETSPCENFFLCTCILYWNECSMAMLKNHE